MMIGDVRLFARLSLLAALTTAILPAAGTPFIITGKVLDETGAPVREARVTATAAGVTAGATSDPAGIFRLELPSPGNYRVEVEREGFFLFTNVGIALDEGTPLEVHISHLKELAESVDVHYSPPVIDPEQTSDTKRLNNQEILNLPYPASQDYRNALPLMTGAIFDNATQIHLNGGYTRDANYRLNGFDISDPATGGLTTRLNVDTVQSLDWDASRFSPDKGKGSAGTLDIKTEMGDNRWRFGGTNFVPSLGTHGGLHLDHWSPRVKFSGPIRKNRIWFHDAFDTFYALNTVTGLPSGQDRTRSSSGSNLTRFQWNITRSHILTASFLANLSQDRRNGLSILSPAETTLNRRQAFFLGTIKDQWMTAGGLVEFGFAASHTYLRASPQGDQTYVVTPYGSHGNYFADQTTLTGRQEWLVNAFLAPIHARGSHQFEAGINIEHSDLDQAIYRHDYTAVRADNSLIRAVEFEGSPRQFRNHVEAYGYLLDRWSPVESLLIEGGFRTQWDQYGGAAPLAPRVSAAWSPRWANGTKFAGGWGIFYDSLTLNQLALSQEQVSLSTFYGPAGTITGGPVETRFALRPQDLRLPRFALTSFSVERRLPWGIAGKANLISRQGSRGFTFEDTLADPFLNLYVLSNVQRQRYRAAEFALRRTFLAKYEWFASYTRSEARANAVVIYSVDNPLFAPQAAGPLPWDAPNRFLSWGWAPVEKRWFPHLLQPVVGDTDLQILVDYRTGFPFSVTNESGNLVGAPNARRFPAYGTVNIALERRFPFRGYLWAWRVGLINVFNRENPNVVNNDIDSPQFLNYGRGQSRAVNVRLRFLGRK
jgi:hypothetical protein